MENLEFGKRIINITEKLLAVHEEARNPKWVPAIRSFSMGFPGSSDFIEDLVDVQGYNVFRFRDRLYSYGWDDYFFFSVFDPSFFFHMEQLFGHEPSEEELVEFKEYCSDLDTTPVSFDNVFTDKKDRV